MCTACTYEMSETKEYKKLYKELIYLKFRLIICIEKELLVVSTQHTNMYAHKP